MRISISSLKNKNGDNDISDDNDDDNNNNDSYSNDNYNNDNNKQMKKNHIERCNSRFLVVLSFLFFIFFYNLLAVL